MSKFSFFLSGWTQHRSLTRCHHARHPAYTYTLAQARLCPQLGGGEQPHREKLLELLLCCQACTRRKAAMHGGGVLAVAGAGYSSEITFTVVMSCLMAASGGFIFGYDIGITGASSSLNTHTMHACGPIRLHTQNWNWKPLVLCFVLFLLPATSTIYLCAVFHVLIFALRANCMRLLQKFDPILKQLDQKQPEICFASLISESADTRSFHWRSNLNQFDPCVPARSMGTEALCLDAWLIPTNLNGA
jgi:hypothetical protein